MFRLQKLMLEEYREIYEPIIVENPFTQVSESGLGLRQYHIGSLIYKLIVTRHSNYNQPLDFRYHLQFGEIICGLTRSTIIFGCDDFDCIDVDDFHCKELDPEIETFQLVSLMPLQFVKLKFYRKRDRHIMRVTVCGEEDKPMLFEFGGHLYKSLFWKTWRERVATIRLLHSNLFHITASSPFSSTDVLAESEVCRAIVHVGSNYSFSTYTPSCRSQC